MSSVQERLVALVLSNPEARRDVDIELSLPWLRKKSELLQSLEKDILKDVIRNCGYQKAVKDDIIIQQGDRGDCFFIMLTGKTSVFIDTVKTDEDPAAEQTDASKDDKLHREKQDKDKEEEEKEDTPVKKKPFDRNTLGKFIMFFEAGQSFGEIALISEKCIRNATIIADEETDLLVIHRDLFNTYIKASQMAEYKEKEEFVKKCALFRGWNSKFRNLLEMSLRKEVYPYGSVIVQQGSPVDGLVFILSGQAKLVMEPSRHGSQYRDLMKQKDFLSTGNKKKRGKDKNELPHKSQKDSVISPQIGVRRKLGYAAAERRVMSKTVDICCIEKDEIIGDVEMALDLDTCIETVVSTASTTVLILNMKNYERLITKKHPVTVTRLIQSAYSKISTRAKSAKGSIIPLFGYLETELEERLPKPPPPAKRVEILKKKEVVMNQLLDMFIQDKAPLIEPYVPNALFYRMKAAQKNKSLMENPYAQLRSLKQIDEYGKIRRKVPRSIKQLRNNIQAERELLGEDRQEGFSSSYNVRNARPGHSLQSSQHQLTFRSPRPKSSKAQTLRVTECGVEDDRFGASSSHPDNVNRLDHETLADIFDEMEQVNRENQETRMRLVCSATARKQRQEKTGRSKSAAPSAGVDIFEQYYDCETFDWETSETNLKELETRLANFCRSVTPNPSSSGMTGASGASMNITELKRFEVEDPTSVPLPGGTVFVHKKPCKFPKTVPISSGLHKHVRRFMLSKNPVPWRGMTPAATAINN